MQRLCPVCLMPHGCLACARCVLLVNAFRQSCCGWLHLEHTQLTPVLQHPPTWPHEAHVIVRLVFDKNVGEVDGNVCKVRSLQVIHHHGPNELLVLRVSPFVGDGDVANEVVGVDTSRDACGGPELWSSKQYAAPLPGCISTCRVPHGASVSAASMHISGTASSAGTM